MDIHPLKGIIARLRTGQTRRLTPDEMHAIGMGEAPRDPLHGSPDAFAWAFGQTLVRMAGDDASRLADVARREISQKKADADAAGAQESDS
jgi:hypothetical protein